MITALDFCCKYLVLLLSDDICCLMPGKFTFVWYRMRSYLNSTCLYIRSISTKMIHIIISFERLDTSNVFVLPFTGCPAKWEVYFPVSRQWKILQLAFYTNTLKSKQFTLLNFEAMYRLIQVSNRDWTRDMINQTYVTVFLQNQHFIVSLPYIYFWKCFCNSACINTFTLYCKISISFFLDCCKHILRDFAYCQIYSTINNHVAMHKHYPCMYSKTKSFKIYYIKTVIESMSSTSVLNCIVNDGNCKQKRCQIADLHDVMLSTITF